MKEIRKAKYAPECLRNRLCKKTADFVELMPISDIILSIRKGDFSKIGSLLTQEKKAFDDFLFDDDDLAYIKGFYALFDRKFVFSNESYENWQYWLPIIKNLFYSSESVSAIPDFQKNLLSDVYFKNVSIRDLPITYSETSCFSVNDILVAFESGRRDLRRSNFGHKLKAIINLSEKYENIDSFLEFVVLSSPFFDIHGCRSNEFIRNFNIAHDLFPEELISKFAEIAPEAVTDILIEKWK